MEKNERKSNDIVLSWSVNINTFEGIPITPYIRLDAVYHSDKEDLQLNANRKTSSVE